MTLLAVKTRRSEVCRQRSWNMSGRWMRTALVLSAALLTRNLSGAELDSAPLRQEEFVAALDDIQTVNQIVDQAGEVEAPLAELADPWWTSMVGQPLRQQDASFHVSLEEVLVSALAHSKQIQVFSDLPLIRETAIIEADAAFDWNAFMDSRWRDISDPIGNTLTAGAGVNRFRDHQVTTNAGLRRRTTTGGQLEAAQRFGFQDNNSQFFVPDPQGTARLALSFTQPLLRGRGRVYNTSLTLLAQIDQQVATDEFHRQLQAHLLEVCRAYWSLYLERTVLYQKINSYIRGREVLQMLRDRQQLDVQPSQLVSAEATVQQRHSELARAQAAVKNAESRLRALVNDPAFQDAEIIPTDQPSLAFVDADVTEAVTTAYQFRPEIGEAIKKVRAACVRMNMSRQEILPMLNLVTEAYVAGLEDDGDALAAWQRQFDTGEPSYTVGLEYDVPIWNRAASARLRRRRLELRQLRNEYETALANVRLEVEVSVRELTTARNELTTKHQTMQARVAQLAALAERWKRLAGQDVTASLALENLLIAQDHLAQAEFAFLEAQLTYNLSTVNLKKSTGLLLEQEQISIDRYCEDHLPTQMATKPILLPTVGAPSPAATDAANRSVPSQPLADSSDPAPASRAAAATAENAPLAPAPTSWRR